MPKNPISFLDCNRAVTLTHSHTHTHTPLLFFPITVRQHYKALKRRTDGTGRMRHLKTLPRKFKNGFREGTKAKKRSD